MDLKPELKIVDNGLKLITLSLPQSRSVTAMLMINAGSRFEEDRQAGISHFLEHLVFKGTKKYPTSQKLSAAVDNIGAEFNAFTSKEYTGFYVKSAINHLELSLDVLSQLVLKPLLKPKDINKEKGVIIEEINMREDTPLAKVSEEFESLLYNKTGLGREVIGSKKTILGLKQADFLAYCRRWYRPQNMVLGVIGGIDKVKNLSLLIKKYFGRTPNITINQPRPRRSYKKLCHIKESSCQFNQQTPALRLDYKKTQQAHFCLGVRAFPRAHKSRYTMAVLSTILGGSMSSRLFTEVREKRGLAYYIKSNINTYFDNGYLVVQAGTDLNKIDEAVKVIIDEFRKIASVGAGVGADQVSSQNAQKELKKAKEYLKGRLALSLEDSKEIAGFFIEDLLLEKKIRSPKQIIKAVEKVSLADLQKAAKKIFTNQNLNLAVIGPYKKKERFTKILSL